MSVQQTDIKSQERPLVSLIMPVRNEARFIERSLNAVLRQNYPADKLEIIIADGQSDDATLEIIEKLQQKTTTPILVVDNPKRIAPTGLNLAIARAKGQVIIRVDGHCEIEPDYVQNCVDLLLSGKADGVGGPIETIGEGFTSAAVAMAMSSAFGVGGSAFRTVDGREMYTDTVAFPGYTRAVIAKAGAFNEELVRNQDDEYNYRIRKLGGRILLSPAIRSRYYSRSSLRSLWRQYFQYGFWKVRVLQLHPRQMSLRQFVPFAFVLSVLFAFVLALISTGGQILLAVITGSYLAANLAASVYTARRKPGAIFLVSVSYFILHFSYGIGSLVGLVAFRHGWSEKRQIELSAS
jgi:glycosyltransferase involved in cell wall biosynthesis